MERVINSLFKAGLNMPPIFRYLKIPAAVARWVLQVYQARSSPKGKPIVILAQPKSGSTWLENLLVRACRTNSIMPPGAVLYEQFVGESHSYKPWTSIFCAVKTKRVVIKLHGGLSDSLEKMLNRLNIKPIILTRDTDEIIASHLHYVSVTPFHPQHKISSKKDVDIVMKSMKEDLLKWEKESKSKGLGLHVTYEELLADTFSVLEKISNELNLGLSNKEIIDSVNYNQIGAMKKRSVQSQFFRGSKF